MKFGFFSSFVFAMDMPGIYLRFGIVHQYELTYFVPLMAARCRTLCAYLLKAINKGGISQKILQYDAKFFALFHIAAVNRKSSWLLLVFFFVSSRIGLKIDSIILIRGNNIVCKIREGAKKHERENAR